MAKTVKYTKLVIESVNGTQTDMTQYFKSATFFSMEEMRLEAIVSKRTDDWICYIKDHNKIWECGATPLEAVEKMEIRLGAKGMFADD